MNVLDENIIESQYQLLKRWRISVRQIGQDLSRKGIQDDEIIPFLLTLQRPTFFTRDLGFFGRGLCHRSYCLVSMAVDKYESAIFVRRLLNHPDFNTQTKRMGTVLRLSSRGIQVWRLNGEKEEAFDW
ncbi:MAG: hypothetical protein KJZ86_20815 [Caldilineaceae bacterium]|nr:hypothetical protein [Caldilineaceae bacterium]HRJ42508.1 hypothetical protein [Caldilineaceae bacterium]